MNKPAIILVVGMLLFSTILEGCIETGNGTAVDTVYDVSYDGLIWKTYIVYLTNDHPTRDYSAIYTVNKDNAEVIKLLEEARDNQRKVRIYYTNNLVYLPWEYTPNAVALIYKVEYVT